MRLERSVTGDQRPFSQVGIVIPIDDERARRAHHAAALVHSDELALGEDTEVASEKLRCPRLHPRKDPTLKIYNGRDVILRHPSNDGAASLTTGHRPPSYSPRPSEILRR